jgi:hypothetical protein
MQALGRCVVGETCKTPSILEAQEEERVILAGQYYLVSFRCLVLRRLGPPQLPRKNSRYRSLHHTARLNAFQTRRSPRRSPPKKCNQPRASVTVKPCREASRKEVIAAAGLSRVPEIEKSYAVNGFRKSLTVDAALNLNRPLTTHKTNQGQRS